MHKTLFKLALVVVLSAGCGGGTAPESGTEADETSAAAAPADAPPETPEPAADEPAVEITGPVTVAIETDKGTIEFETFPEDAPRTVDRILELVQDNFYRGQRFHRVVPGFVIQVGDPASRDMTQQDRWGQGGSGERIGVAEIAEGRSHVHGAVAMAHAGDPAQADSQFYITMAARPELDGKYTIFGQVTSGLDIVEKIEVGDAIRDMYIKQEDGAESGTASP